MEVLGWGVKVECYSWEVVDIVVYEYWEGIGGDGEIECCEEVFDCRFDEE